MKRSVLAALSSAALALMASIPVAAAGTSYHLVKTIDLPGSQGGHGDWTTFDPQSNTVWLSQSPDHEDVVIDARSNTVKATIPGIQNGNGIALTPKYAFLTDNASNVVVVVDKQTFQKVATLTPDGKGPNGAVYDPKTDEVYIATDNSDDVVTVFKAEPPFTKVTAFNLSPHPAKDGPDVGLYAAAKGLIYWPVDNVVDVIDPNQHKVIDVWKPGVQHSAKPIVYDPTTNRFILGSTDKKMYVLDGSSGAVVATIPVRGAVDETVIDPGARRAFIGDKAGVIEVVDLDSDKIVQVLPSEKNVHTLAVDTNDHVLYVYRNESNKVDVFGPSSSVLPKTGASTGVQLLGGALLFGGLLLMLRRREGRQGA